MTIDDFDISLEESQVNSLRCYVAHLMRKWLYLEGTETVEYGIQGRSGAVYRLTMARSLWWIDHDSARWLKPTHVLRSVHDHVRTYDSCYREIAPCVEVWQFSQMGERHELKAKSPGEALVTAYEDVLGRSRGGEVGKWIRVMWFLFKKPTVKWSLQMTTEDSINLLLAVSCCQSQRWTREA